MHVDAVQKGDKAVVIDDLVATGGTLTAAIKLLECNRAEVVEFACVIGVPEIKIDALCKVIPRQIKVEKAVSLKRQTVEELIMKRREIVETEAEGERINEEENVNDTDPSILRFLLASREEVSSSQLRDHLLSMS